MAAPVSSPSGPGFPGLRGLLGQVPRRNRPLTFSLAATFVVLAAYLAKVPPVPDLAAQITRATVARQSGVSVWWSGWFGGLHLPTYSELTPTLMAHLGAPATGAIAVLASVAAMALLLRGSLRPVAGSLAFAASSVVDLVNGRITFAVGLAAGLWALWALTRRRPVIAAALGILTCLTSPLAAFFLGIAAVALVIGDRRRRWAAAALGSAIAVTAAGLAVLFPGTGQMPSPWLQVLPAVPAALAVALACPQRVIRAGGVMVAVIALLTLVVPTSVGENITRIVWVFAAPLVIAYAPLRIGSFGRWPLAVLAGTLALWPVIDLGEQLSWAAQPSTYEAYYEPLIGQLAAQTRAAGPTAIGERVEVLDPATHGADRYVAASFPLARGWDRQADRSDNPIFYVNGALTAASYQSWLAELSVGWVAVPHGTLDYASDHEKTLIAQGLSYLKPVWSSADWSLYQVKDARPLLSGPGQIVSSDPTGLTFRADAAGTLDLQLRWSPYLVARLDGPKGKTDPDVCFTKAGDWTQLRTPGAGTWTLVADFTAPLLRPSSPDCATARS
jgi:hypothetical protein